MNVQTLCLAILHDLEATGYEIRNMCTDGEYGYFVNASFGSIYPALAKLEQAGHVSCRVEVQDGKPSKKIYQITGSGRDEFRKELLAPLDVDVHKSEFLLFARFAHLMPASLVAERVEMHLGYFKAMTAMISSIETNTNDGGNKWVMRHSEAVLGAMLDDIEKHKHELIALAVADEKSDMSAK